MTYFSHSKTKDGKIIGSKRLIDHIQGVQKKALHRLAAAATQFTQFNTHDLQKIIEIITLYHDLGKYTSYFQNYLLGSKAEMVLKQHAKLGGYAAYQFALAQDEERMALLTLYLIVHHHKDLTSISTLLELTKKRGEVSGGYTNFQIFEAQKANLKPHLLQIQTELNHFTLKEELTFPDKNDLLDSIESLEEEPSIENYFLINYLFSLLIEADKLDASDTPLYVNQLIPNDLVAIRIRQFPIHPLRQQVRERVLTTLQRVPLETQKMFSLTAPTGVGKTLLALEVALQLKACVPELATAPIIYALPFINIIEQGLNEYQMVLGNHAHILAHYQYADVFGQSSKTEEDEDKQAYHQKAMALDTWQADVVITSFVQFFQTLIGNQNKILKKFNHLANSIVILDEIQTIRLEQLPLIGASLHYLSKYLNTRILLMTATKPKMMDLAQSTILKQRGETANVLELLDHHEHIYDSYKRTKIVPLLDLTFEKGNEARDLVEKVFAIHWKTQQSCLIVVNKVDRCIQVFKEVKDYLENNDLNNPIFCLSTNILPIHRFDRIMAIKTALENGEKPILIATQVVEAGVDLDFDMGIRDLSPIDSIVQVAGRINRGANPMNPKMPNLPLYVPNLGDCQSIYGSLTEKQAISALKGKAEILESDYLGLVDSYFEAAGASADFEQKSISIFKAMETLTYEEVNDFELLEKQRHTVAVFVAIDDPKDIAKNCKEAYLNFKKGFLSKENFNIHFKNNFHKHIIAVPKHYAKQAELPPLDDFIWLARADQYDEQTGFIRKAKADEIQSFF